MAVLPLKQHIVARLVAKGHLKLFYGSTLKEAMETAGVQEGEKFAVASYERGPIMRGQLKNGRTTQVKFDRTHGF